MLEIGEDPIGGRIFVITLEKDLLFLWHRLAQKAGIHSDHFHFITTDALFGLCSFSRTGGC
jgi:hypothetical protein